MRTFLILLTLLTLLCCEPEKRHETGHFDESVKNFEAVNSAYDDYNSTAPFIDYRYLFHFSSNRKSAGNNFDIVGETMFIEWNKDRGSLIITNDEGDRSYDYVKPMIDQINTSCNELGPYSIGFYTPLDNNDYTLTDLTLFANDCDGNYDIKFIYSELHKDDGTTSADIKPLQSVAFLNSESDDLYPTFFGEHFSYYNGTGMDASNIEKILFCSDREGEFNIYSVDMPAQSNLIESLQFEEQFEIKKLSINSVQDDKCPFVNGTFLVFSSNRAGGYGGFDLYYSEFTNGAWTEPTNFGDQINTEYDEYRPIILQPYEFDNNLMIFSSNRPEGKGGYDLYHVGIPQSKR